MAIAIKSSPKLMKAALDEAGKPESPGGAKVTVLELAAAVGSDTWITPRGDQQMSHEGYQQLEQLNLSGELAPDAVFYGNALVEVFGRQPQHRLPSLERGTLDELQRVRTSNQPGDLRQELRAVVESDRSLAQHGEGLKAPLIELLMSEPPSTKPAAIIESLLEERRPMGPLPPKPSPWQQFRNDLVDTLPGHGVKPGEVFLDFGKGHLHSLRWAIMNNQTPSLDMLQAAGLDARTARNIFNALAGGDLNQLQMS